MKIRSRLILGYAIVVALIALVAANGLLQGQRSIRDIEILADEVTPDTLLAVDLRTDVILIQQFLTDVALTGRRSGEAAESAAQSYQHAVDGFTTFIETHHNRGEGQIAEGLEQLLERLHVYYETGVEMAGVYIDQGRTEGNRMMDTFDEVALLLTSELEDLVSDHVEEQRAFLATLEDRTSSGIALGAIVALVSIVLGVIISLATSRSINRPVTTLTEMTETAAQGDLRAVAEVRGNDELSSFGERFGEFVSGLRDIISGIQQSALESDTIRQELAAGAEETSSAVIEISASIESISKQAEDMGQGLETAASSSDQIARTVERMNEQIESQAAMVEQSTAAISQMVAAVNTASEITTQRKENTDRLVSTAEAGGRTVAEMIVAVKEIETSIDDIRNITGIISGIAGQTNMLSMNAAIEAAHAGEFGKGFAVVAEEIRKLAETSSENSNRIAGILANMIASIDGVSTAASSTEQVYDSVHKEVKEVSDAFSEIRDHLSQLLSGAGELTNATTTLQDMTVSIREAFSEINSGVTSSASSVETINQIASGLVGALSEISIGARDISAAMTSITSMSTRLGDVMSALTTKVQHFVIGEESNEAV